MISGGFATVFNLWPIMSAKRSGGSLEYFENLREQVYEATKSVTNSERNKAVLAPGPGENEKSGWMLGRW